MKDTPGDSLLEKLGPDMQLKLPMDVRTPILPVGRLREDVGGECFAPRVALCNTIVAERGAKHSLL